MQLWRSRARGPCFGGPAGHAAAGASASVATRCSYGPWLRQEIGVGNGGASEASGVIVVAKETLARVGVGHRRIRPPRPSRAGPGEDGPGIRPRLERSARRIPHQHPPPRGTPSEGHGSCDGTTRPCPRSSIKGPTGAVSGARPRTRTPTACACGRRDRAPRGLTDPRNRPEFTQRQYPPGLAAAKRADTRGSSAPCFT